MVSVNDIRAMEVANLKRSGHTLAAIAKALDVNAPLSRQRIGQIVKRGEALLKQRSSPLYLANLDRDLPITEEVAFRLGLSGRLCNTLGRLKLSPAQIDHMLVNRRDELVNYPGVGVKTFNALSDFFGRPRWETRHLGHRKYKVKTSNAIS